MNTDQNSGKLRQMPGREILQDPRLKYGCIVCDGGIGAAEGKRISDLILARMSQIPDIDFPDVSIVELDLVRGIHFTNAQEVVVYLTLTTPECKHADTIIGLAEQALALAVSEANSPWIKGAFIDPFLPHHVGSGDQVFEATQSFTEAIGNPDLHPAVKAVAWDHKGLDADVVRRIRAHFDRKTSPPLTVNGQQVDTTGNETARQAILDAVGA